MLAIAEGQLATMLNLPPSSRAGSLPQFGSVPACDCPANTNPLWEQSLLAIAVGQSALMLNMPPSSRASFAPTIWIGASLRFPGQQKSPVGAKLARDSGGSVCLDVEHASVIASKLCSHNLDRCQPAISRPTQIPCGSKACSAIAVGQSALMLNMPPSSRASFAPTIWIGASLRFPGQHKSPVGAKLAHDSRGTACLDVESAAVIASKLCSHSLDRC